MKSNRLEILRLALDIVKTLSADEPTNPDDYKRVMLDADQIRALASERRGELSLTADVIPLNGSGR